MMASKRTNCRNGRKTGKSSSKNVWKGVKNVIINVKNTKCNVSADPEVYSKSDIKRLKMLVDHFGKDILIDRTYVNYNGNRFKDAFIKEDGWNDLVELIKSTDTSLSVRKCDDIMECVLALSIVYLYNIVEKYGFESSSINIEFVDNMRFYGVYKPDKRTSWNF